MDQLEQTPLRVSIIIPAYNEGSAIGLTIEDYQFEFPEAQIIVVDNNSNDETSDVASSKLRPGTDFLLSETRQGKGHAVKRGISRLSADIYIVTDGDLTYPAQDAKKLFDSLLDQRADMMVGDRRAGGTYEMQNHRFGHTSGNALLTRLVSLLSGKHYNDVLSGLRIMSAPFVRSLDVRSDGFQLETEINIVAAYMRADVVEVPIQYDARPEGSISKLSTFKDGFRILQFSVLNWIAFLPMQFFSFVAATGWFLALLMGYRVLSGFLETGWPYSTSAILGAASGIIGTLALFTGLSLRIQNRWERRRDVATFLENKRIWNTRLDDAGI